jgi:hypothetical protein
MTLYHEKRENALRGEETLVDGRNIKNCDVLLDLAIVDPSTPRSANVVKVPLFSV